MDWSSTVTSGSGQERWCKMSKINKEFGIMLQGIIDGKMSGLEAQKILMFTVIETEKNPKKWKGSVADNFLKNFLCALGHVAKDA